MNQKTAEMRFCLRNKMKGEDQHPKLSSGLHPTLVHMHTHECACIHASCTSGYIHIIHRQKVLIKIELLKALPISL